MDESKRIPIDEFIDFNRCILAANPFGSIRWEAAMEAYEQHRKQAKAEGNFPFFNEEKQIGIRGRAPIKLFSALNTFPYSYMNAGGAIGESELSWKHTS